MLGIRGAIRLVVAVFALGAAIAIGACGGDDGDGDGGEAAAGGDLSGTMEFWWWGREQAPGFGKWLKSMAAAFEEENPGVKVKLVEQTTDNIVQAAQAAQAAQEGPDLQFYWPVGWFQEDMFNGGLTPLDDLLGDEVISHFPAAARDYATWKGEVFAAPLYSVGNPWSYRKDLFKKAGLDPEDPPETFDELLAAGEKLKAAGITPIAAGMKDQWYADWPWLLFQPCGIDSADEWFDAFLGRRSLTEPAFTQTWEKIAKTRDLYSDDLFDVTLYEGFDALLNGEAAIATPDAPAVVRWERKLGDKLGVFLTPCQDESPLAGKYPDAWQLLAIPTFSDQKEEAAAFIKFMRRPENGASLYEQAGAFLGHDELAEFVEPDGPVSEQLLEWSKDNYFALYFTAPPAIDEWIWPIVADLLRGGDLSPAEAAQKAQETHDRWLDRNQRLAENFAEWQDQVTATSK